jgi:TRAP-type mannitol/chloroaromatic compound transport system substrate-binding protein
VNLNRKSGVGVTAGIIDYQGIRMKFSQVLFVIATIGAYCAAAQAAPKPVAKPTAHKPTGQALPPKLSQKAILNNSAAAKAASLKMMASMKMKGSKRAGQTVSGGTSDANFAENFIKHLNEQDRRLYDAMTPKQKADYRMLAEKFRPLATKMAHEK